LLTWAVLTTLAMAPPEEALVPPKVPPLTVNRTPAIPERVPTLAMAPPAPVAVLLLKSVLVTATVTEPLRLVTELNRRPPLAALSFVKVSPLRVSAADPVLFTTKASPPPPRPALLPVRVLLSSVSEPSLSMPAPKSATLPPAMVRPEMVTLVPAKVWKTRWALPPLTVIVPAPGSWMVRFLVTASSPLVRLIVPLRELSKTMVSPEDAAAIWPRSEPSPLSLRLVTVRVLGTERSSRDSRAGRKRDFPEGRRVRARGRGRPETTRGAVRCQNGVMVRGPGGNRVGTRLRGYSGAQPVRPCTFLGLFRVLAARLCHFATCVRTAPTKNQEKVRFFSCQLPRICYK
jgi:hypothetical protein